MLRLCFSGSSLTQQKLELPLSVTQSGLCWSLAERAACLLRLLYGEACCQGSLGRRLCLVCPATGPTAQGSQGHRHCPINDLRPRKSPVFT